MDNVYKYNVNLEWLEGRKGKIASANLNSVIEVATPPEFSKGIAGIWSPEHLFIGAVSSCFMTTFMAIAENSALDFNKFDCGAIGLVELREGNLAVSEITLIPKLVINDHRNVEKALKVIQLTKKKCLISNSVRSDIKVIPSVIVATATVNL